MTIPLHSQTRPPSFQKDYKLEFQTHSPPSSPSSSPPTHSRQSYGISKKTLNFRVKKLCSNQALLKPSSATDELCDLEEVRGLSEPQSSHLFTKQNKTNHRCTRALAKGVSRGQFLLLIASFAFTPLSELLSYQGLGFCIFASNEDLANWLPGEWRGWRFRKEHVNLSLEPELEKLGTALAYAHTMLC
jgi:hypothetical protein